MQWGEGWGNKQTNKQKKWEWIPSGQNPQGNSTSREVTRHQNSVKILGDSSSCNEDPWYLADVISFPSYM